MEQTFLCWTLWYKTKDVENNQDNYMVEELDEGSESWYEPLVF